MAEQVYIEDIAQHTGQEVAIKGWLADKTDKGRLQFLRVRDGTGFIQAVVIQKQLPAEQFEQVKRLTQESSIIVTGVPRAEPRAPGGYELGVNSVEVVQLASEY